ncbi:hypothetical protein [Rodentibacter pneumotropicus]|uniref:hypothetical protein n=1 Tax=Rodentibacter pneumotropicus TaxID=758 RepID=UPI000984CE7A|nr:hypothetical protein [Rodentibacter pneumotropicus]OOF64777.1 hypothetical protein BKL50_00790 [Rodentibacter pneumotropicus]
MNEIKITPSLPLAPSSKDYSELKEVFSYVVDCLAEISMSISMLTTNRIKFIYVEPYNVYLLERMFFNTIFLNICRFDEALSSKRLFNKYFNKEKAEIDNILRKYKKGIKNYRNTYLAHPENKQKKISSPQERTQMIKGIFTNEQQFINDIDKLRDVLFKLCHYFDLAKKVT